MELKDLVPHNVVLAGDGLGIFSGLGTVSNIETSEVNFLAAPGLDNGLDFPVLGISTFLEDDIWANLLFFLTCSILSLVGLALQPFDLLGTSWVEPCSVTSMMKLLDCSCSLLGGWSCSFTGLAQSVITRLLISLVISLVVLAPAGML